MSGTPQVIRDIRKRLKELDHPENKIDTQRFHKEKVKNRYILRTSLTRKVSNRFFRDVKDLSKNDIFALAELLMDSGITEERVIGFDWIKKIRERFAKSDFGIFRKWFLRYVSGWGSCDHFCSAILGPYLIKYPEVVTEMKSWAGSNHRWKKRASAVALIPPIENRMLFDEAFEIADILLEDEDDLVQKGYGWMLKVISERDRERVFDYVYKNRRSMPRTALRYAIEKMPADMRRKAMAR